MISVGFYGMSTFEGPMMSIRAVNSLSHYTDWTIGHVHSGRLGWNGMITFGRSVLPDPDAVESSSVSTRLVKLALLARNHRHRSLRGIHVGDGDHGRSDVARSRQPRLPCECLCRHRGRQASRCMWCVLWVGCSTSPARSSWCYNMCMTVRRSP